MRVTALPQRICDIKRNCVLLVLDCYFEKIKTYCCVKKEQIIMFFIL